MISRIKRSLIASTIACLMLSVLNDARSADRIYMGEITCRKCHHGASHNQFNPWRLSPHANAYAALAMPESKEIALLSGIDVDPFESPVCLGCHSTASNVETWERDDLFYPEDGIQCEFCHGPGSEYSEIKIMVDKQAAMKAGLKMPGEEFCMICHKEKGSHTAVLDVKPFNYKEALKTIEHSESGDELKLHKKKNIALLDGPKYVGVMACAKCHRGDKMGYLFSQWRLSSHANAFAVLQSEKGRENAKSKGLGDPQEADECLRCHTTGHGEPEGRFLESFDPAQGVQCESCHGPGSDYMAYETMKNPEAARETGLWKVSRDTCVKCHRNENFDFDAMKKKIDHSIPEPSEISLIEYKSPHHLALSKDGKRLYTACEASDSLIVVDTQSGEILAEIKIENQPHDVCLSPDETRAYVSNRGTDTVSVVDTQSFQVVGTIEVGDEPHGVMTDLEGELLYVVNTGSYDVSVVDLKEGKEIKRLSAARGAWGIERSPDGKQLYVTNNLSHFVKFREPCLSEVSVIGTDRAVIENRFFIPETNMIQGVDFSPDGEFALVTMIRTKNLVPMTRVMQGWVLTNGIAVLWKDGRVDQLLLDEGDSYFADPTDIAITPDGKYAYITGGGVNEVAVIDLKRMKAVLARASDEERKNVLPNHLGVATEYVLKRIPVGHSPRGVKVSSDGRFVYVAEGLNDTISVIDVERQERIRTIDLGGPKKITLQRKGERIFHSAEVTYGRQFSCHSCHPDGGIDGITYDIEPDGIGINPVDNRTLRGILDTAPFKWTGKNPSLSRQCGPRLAVFFTRIDPFTPEQVAALDRYICTIPRNPNRYRVEGELTPAQWNGKVLFERAYDNSGKEIPVDNRCSTCHPAPYYTNRMKADIGADSPLDTDKIFDVPHLNNIYETAPYMHDGRSDTLEEIWTRFNPYDTHGVTNDMTKDQLKDLIEYLRIL